MCPVNRIGKVDLYLVSHHGIERSNSPALVHGLQPRVAIMNNGTRKGGAPDTFKVLETSRGLEDLWQLHWSYNVGVEHNAPGVFIANIDDNETIAGVLTAPPPAPARRGCTRGARRSCARSPTGGRCTGRAGAAPWPRGGGRSGTWWRIRGWWRRGAFARLLAQSLGGARRHVHGHEPAQRIQQDVPAARLERPYFTSNAKTRSAPLVCSSVVDGSALHERDVRLQFREGDDHGVARVEMRRLGTWRRRELPYRHAVVVAELLA